ncbi:LOW QUALITY PROTEIN: hypothetical protein Cgig2_023012 [Carnegiea gigantea]|uniref:Uncharacterized protein n=1 Tax=Carnegiea gigantea TaxID=171969 RepID=A0A9Q1K9G0_9CARY|nr:LOW QUALITY PROTEIN: hypothetical protein Cgig2_023012 [Carnegiea gigantea]
MQDSNYPLVNDASLSYPFYAFIGRGHNKSKKNPYYSAFDLVEDCFGPQDHNHVARFGYDMTPKDVRGPLPSRAELFEKENVSQHKHIDDLEDAHKREIKKLEDHMRIVVEMVMSTQPPSDTLRVVLLLDLIMTKMIRLDDISCLEWWIIIAK